MNAANHSASGRHLPPVVINDVPMPVLEVNGERVVTLAMIDRVHGRPDGTASRNFRENQSRFTMGKHYHVSSSDEIRRNNPDALPPAFRRPEITVLTQRGYLKLVKSFTDDLAWDLQDMLVDGYFEKRTAVPQAIDMRDTGQLRLVAAQLIELTHEKDELIAALTPKAQALDRLETSEGSVGPRLAAKMLGMPERKFTAWLQSNGWAFRQNGIGPLQAHVEKRNRGYLDHRPHTFRDQVSGEDRTIAQMMITPKGLKRLAELLSGGRA